MPSRRHPSGSIGSTATCRSRTRAALKAAGVTRATANIAGGEIVRATERRADRRAQGQRDGPRRQGRAAAVRRDGGPRPARGDEVRQRARRHVGAQHGHVETSWTRSRAPARANTLTTRIYAAVPLDTWEKLRDAVAGEDVRRRRRPRRRVAARRRPEGIRRRLARLAHRGVPRAVQRTRRRIAACSSTRRRISTAGSPAPTRPGCR